MWQSILFFGLLREVKWLVENMFDGKRGKKSLFKKIWERDFCIYLDSLNFLFVNTKTAQKGVVSNCYS